MSSYRLVLASDSVDLYQFEDLVAGVAPAGRLEDWPLALWTDRPLRGVVDRPFVREVVEYLSSVRSRVCSDMVREHARAGRANYYLYVVDNVALADQGGMTARALNGNDLHAMIDNARAYTVYWPTFPAKVYGTTPPL